jgi:hypothetical protein
MGHIRVGRLPKTFRWRAVVGMLTAAPEDVPGVARASMVAAEERLRELARDPSLAHCFWLLTRIAWASRGPDFPNELARLGLHADPTQPAHAFIAQVSDQARTELARHPESGHFSELASLALRRALSDTIGQEGRSLFGSSVEDLQQAFRRFSTERRFATLAKYFFGDFFARTLRFFVEKELSNCVGPGHTLRSVDASDEFAQALDVYARQSARIMETFAAGWYGKQNWESKGAISPEDAQGFVAVALRKLRMELTRPEPS